MSEKEIKILKEKLNEVISKLNFISEYYENKGDYAGIITELKSE